ncbi:MULTISPECIES: biotin/lipoyl-containing protein [Mycolicibacterium]|jgi:pyruvate/2-oxoglutarate dehydrogenase complex dihydrolipoamide acyltransferase (E2) component|uniref:Biotin/lipoyl attachment domain-containing protein n=1 Tax=Mycolicibacterium vanbaalenii (strain DSM 7251 / JCM 13017 / BCRC 16820 / KCTC 9966 / NRRL B-24157 / PYR-1) TaxID=350058 RepID=A1T3K1_MYCVP|nr:MULTISPECIES: lipoyl domain-containing protein [Mycolicibacterium]ABM11751.1 biotin/lipoyl attachment domain-containing protein [Mycolicibacterium vanbaalenii PYR-1]MCV7127871.1 biotin/lipoyl-binding protein [Mycolicibacterium vanbaalenii PYR-1]QZT57726.1 lipoyl domain-containing protein [Mycolicibacterium austroafricanum]UJL29339.1 biotin/lipoyl-binding protein [Mycolicibacterium vanbaalenii]WND57633.1 lipoyl domain-containing protein [Mycolicibacterium vanbaalenii]
MAEILFPAMSENDPEAEGVVSTWFVADGDHVEEGDLIAEVAVDKADMEIVAPRSGLISLLVAEDQAVTQNSPIAKIA